MFTGSLKLQKEANHLHVAVPRGNVESRSAIFAQAREVEADACQKSYILQAALSGSRDKYFVVFRLQAFQRFGMTLKDRAGRLLVAAAAGADDFVDRAGAVDCSAVLPHRHCSGGIAVSYRQHIRRLSVVAGQIRIGAICEEPFHAPLFSFRYRKIFRPHGGMKLGVAVDVSSPVQTNTHAELQFLHRNQRFAGLGIQAARHVERFDLIIRSPCSRRAPFNTFARGVKFRDQRTMRIPKRFHLFDDLISKTRIFLVAVLHVGGFSRESRMPSAPFFRPDPGALSPVVQFGRNRSPLRQQQTDGLIHGSS